MLTTGSTYTTINGYAAYNTGTSVPVYYTSGFGSSLVDQSGRTAPCPTSFSAVSYTIFETSPSGFPQITGYTCGHLWDFNALYRTIQVVTTTTSQPPTTTVTTTPGPTKTTTSDIGTNPTTTAVPHPDPDPPAPAPASRSKAWIAGVVVGPVVGLALTGLLGWWIVHRRKAGTKAAAGRNSQYYGQPVAT
ncbi:hypothetical protein PGQ11_010669 [Apiospora arundinis]|uniref:Uncharacterized protein n=1 Tax=Apiospora arundinis TaxID=335852 RepID=A0ABR2ICC7_9PEZI